MALSRVLVALAILTAGCGGTPPPAAPKPAPAKAAERPVTKLPPGHLPRADVDRVVLANGPPWILSRVPVEEVIKDGKFVGWRVLGLPPDWAALDLKPGDVVTRVNGMSLERPEDLWSAWTSLVVASDLKIAYEREGAPRELTFHIEGEPSKELPAAMTSEEPPPRAKPAPGGPAPRKQTIVIVGDDSSSAED